MEGSNQTEEGNQSTTTTSTKATKIGEEGRKKPRF